MKPSPEHIVKEQIGTDVKYSIRVIGKTPSHKVSIQSVEAFFINTTLQQCKKCQERYYNSHLKFLRRYPVEPLVNDYISTAYCLNNSGAYCYNTHPVNCYKGFGIEPFGHNHQDHKCHEHDESVCKALVYYTDDKSVVQVYFPADLQKHTGIYDLMIRVKIHNDSYQIDHSKTFSITYEGILELNGDAEDLPDGIEDIIIDSEDHPTPSSDDLYVISGELNNNNLDLTLSDFSSVPSIDMSREFAWGGDDLNVSDNNGN